MFLGYFKFGRMCPPIHAITLCRKCLSWSSTFVITEDQQKQQKYRPKTDHYYHKWFILRNCLLLFHISVVNWTLFGAKVYLILICVQNHINVFHELSTDYDFLEIRGILDVVLIGCKDQGAASIFVFNHIWWWIHSQLLASYLKI